MGFETLVDYQKLSYILFAYILWDLKLTNSTKSITIDSVCIYPMGFET